MKDIRLLEKQADEFIKLNKRLAFRLLLANGNLVEMSISPLKPTPKLPTIYRVIRRVFKPHTGTIDDIINVDTSSLKRVEAVELATKSEEGCTIQNLLVSLLDMGYVYVGGDV